ncbi:hypothetical protein F5Y00DRAFT_247100 [Daldinia vernicosa]|uniref:uncharacterized protein n=1 Tax=Daldinia vernicosa TaxID=114800 RepID=UPI002008E40C|nr:uncharacterized protein F5Y00DRAFT_247100 [Daldinia vernicosa]KAI0845127.1 hypothetical protein F5Y00DRAFT_247100 [Daldinia vernicosa]
MVLCTSFFLRIFLDGWNMHIYVVCIVLYNSEPGPVIGQFDRWTTGGSEPHNLHNSSFFAKALSRWWLCSAATLHSQSLNAVQPARDAESSAPAHGAYPVEGRDGMQVRMARRRAMDHIRHSAPSRERLRL